MRESGGTNEFKLEFSELMQGHADIVERVRTMIPPEDTLYDLTELLHTPSIIPSNDLEFIWLACDRKLPRPSLREDGTYRVSGAHIVAARIPFWWL